MLLREFFHNPKESDDREPDLKSILKVFLPFAKKAIKLDKMPSIVLKKFLEQEGQPTMGRFHDQEYTLELAVANRQPVDILRTLAHELVHAKQHREHVELDSTTGSDTENEANVVAGIVMREFNKSHPHFLKMKPVSEGGNLELPGQGKAQDINLKVQNRSVMVGILNNLLHAINNTYAKQFKTPLWNPKLIQSQQFLSGSSLHFFNVKGIPDEVFVNKKPKVGDIDTMVDKTQKENLEQFLQGATNKEIGPAIFRGYKLGNEQFSSMWELQNPPTKIQIDLEFVDYNQGEPTEWAKYSHSSSWEDLSQGVKGVFHKYLMRALTTSTLKQRYIQTKTGKIQAKPINSTDLAFAVASGAGGGLREKYRPVMDPQTNQQKMIDGIPVYTEVAPGDSQYTSDVGGMFSMLFGQQPSEADKKLLWSFTGGLQLANKLLDDQSRQKVADGFLNTLYGPGAQGMYRNDPQRDQEEKGIAWNTLLNSMKVPDAAGLKTRAEQMAKEYYAKYKVAESIQENVAASPRQGIQHLQGMKDLEFIDFVKRLKTEMQGKVHNVKMTLKVDGLGARFGKDKTGRPFFESSRSGPIFTAGTFTGYAKSQGFDGEKLERAAHYDEIFNIIINSNFVKRLPNDTKVECEVLYNPMAEETANGLKFVTVAYDRKFLGKVMTIVPFDSYIASTGARHPKSDQIKDMLVNVGEEQGIKFVDDRLGYNGEVDLNGEIDPILSIVNDRLIAKLTSRTKADAEEKQQIKAFLAAAKDSIANYVLSHPNILGKEKMGKDAEGVIIHRQQQAPVKITTPQFKQAMAAKKQQGQEQDVTEPAI